MSIIRAIFLLLSLSVYVSASLQDNLIPINRLNGFSRATSLKAVLMNKVDQCGTYKSTCINQEYGSILANVIVYRSNSEIPDAYKMTMNNYMQHDCATGFLQYIGYRASMKVTTVANQYKAKIEQTYISFSQFIVDSLECEEPVEANIEYEAKQVKCTIYGESATIDLDDLIRVESLVNISFTSTGMEFSGLDDKFSCTKVTSIGCTELHPETPTSAIPTLVIVITVVIIIVVIIIIVVVAFIVDIKKRKILPKVIPKPTPITIEA